MIVTFQEIKNKVFRSMGFTDISTVDANIEDEIELRINQIQDAIFFDRDWEWRYKKFYFTSRKPYETGTITVTQDSRVVTGVSTVWTDSMKVGYVIIGSIAYKIDKIDSGTSLKLKTKFPNATASAQAYKIVFSDYVLNPYISAIASVALEGKELDIKSEDRLLYNIADVGTPIEFALIYRTDEDFYSTGTVTVTNNSVAVTGSGTAWTAADMEGKAFKVNEFSEPYVVREVTDTTNLVLDREYGGASGAGKAYKIDPAGGLALSLRPTPDDHYYLEVRALIVPFKLVNNNDISLIPNHSPLLHGSTWLALLDFEDRNPVRLQQSEADYKRTLAQLQSAYRIVKGLRWQHPTEIAIRRAGSGQRFNPLDG